jgi:hypothetical protein
MSPAIAAKPLSICVQCAVKFTVLTLLLLLLILLLPLQQQQSSVMAHTGLQGALAAREASAGQHLSRVNIGAELERLLRGTAATSSMIAPAATALAPSSDSAVNTFFSAAATAANNGSSDTSGVYMKYAAPLSPVVRPPPAAALASQFSQYTQRYHTAAMGSPAVPPYHHQGGSSFLQTPLGGISVSSISLAAAAATAGGDVRQQLDQMERARDANSSYLDREGEFLAGLRS